MATTNVGFLKKTNATLSGSTVGAAGDVVAIDGTCATQLAAAGYGTRLDRQVLDLATAGYAKNAGVNLTLTGSTAITINLALLAAATGVVISGDTVFATVNLLILNNTGAADLTVNTGASNGFSFPNGGTAPTYTVPAGSRLVIESVAGITVDGTHKNITVTPTSGGALGICVGGA